MQFGTLQFGTLQFGTLQFGTLQFGTLPRELTERNIRMFASEGVTALQALPDKPYADIELSSTSALA